MRWLPAVVGVGACGLSYLASASVRISSERLRRLDERPLPDVGFAWLPSWHAEWACFADSLVVGHALLMALVVLGNQRPWLALARLLTLFCGLNVISLFVLPFTTLPYPSQQCTRFAGLVDAISTRLPWYQRLASELWLHVTSLVMPFTFHSCDAGFWSSQAACALLCLATWVRAAALPARPPVCAPSALLAVGPAASQYRLVRLAWQYGPAGATLGLALALVCSRAHYSGCVVISSIVAWVVASAYFALIDASAAHTWVRCWLDWGAAAYELDTSEHGGKSE